MVSIEIDHLQKSFGETVALNDVSLVVEPGELYFLLGPSGCGKTTLLRCLAGFYLPGSGTIRFGDRDVTRLEPHRRNTGMVFQSYALWPHMSVRENVAFGLAQRKLSRDEIRRKTSEALESVHMASYADRKPNQLSGGQQQRVALARALVIRPQCLLLDEPLSNLDAKLRHEMRSEIRRICKEFQLTTVYVTHDQKEALSIADRMAVLDSGRILQVGTPLDVYKRPRNRFVAGFIGDTNFISGTVLRAGAGEALVDTPLGELRGALSDPDRLPRQGQTVELCIRPECVQLSRMAPEENAFRGSIGQSTYYGEVAHYLFHVNGTSVAVSELNPRHLGGREQADLCGWVDPDDVVILNE